MRALPLVLMLASITSKLSLPVIAGEPTYAKPELLVEPAALEAMLEEGDVVVLHAATPQVYFRARVPGAVLVDVGKWNLAFAAGSDPQAWSERISNLGIGPKTRVVVYDEGGRPRTSAARIWWILKYWGVEQAAILNGGLQAWVDHAGAPIPQDDPQPKPGGFVAKSHPDRLRTTEQMIQLSKSGKEHFIDTRSRDEVSAGAIGAAAEHCEWIECIDRKTGRFKGPAELAKLFKIDRHTGEDAQPVVTYCGSGGRASVAAFALELMGVEHVANYYGSWSAWKKRGATLKSEPK